MSRALIPCALLALLGCEPEIVDDPDMDPDPDPLDELDWSGAQALVDAAFAENDVGIDGLALIVVDSETDTEVLRTVVGDFDPSETIAVASASKLVTGLVLGRLVTTGSLALDDTTADSLGWGGPQGDITLDQLGAFTSGLAPSPPCTLRPNITLAECVDTISQSSLRATPGERLDYGSAHHAVAARMAEVAEDSGWNNIFDESVKEPLGLDDPAMTYVTFPKQADTDGENPLAAGGLRISTDDYLALLRLVDDGGQLDGEAFIDVAMIDRMFKNPYSDARIGEVPSVALNLAWRYSWSAWLECPGPVDECDLISSPGAFGFTPWVDREHGYYAILAMESPENGGAGFSVELERALQAEIVETLGR